MDKVTRRKVEKTWNSSKKILLTLIMLSVAIIWILPALLGVLTTFKPYGEFMRFAKIKNLFPIEWTLSNYQYVFENSPASVLGMAKNSLIVSTSHNQTFRRITGTTVFDYIIHKRIAYARQLLCNGLSAQQAGAAAGFGDYTSFYRAYKKRTGCSPNQYKQRLLHP